MEVPKNSWEGEVNPRLMQKVESNFLEHQKEGAPFGIFDFDNSCIENDIAEAMFAYLCEKGALKDFNLLEETGDLETYHARVLQKYYELYKSGDIYGAYSLNSRMLSGFTLEEAEAITLETIAAEGTEIGTRELFGLQIARGLKTRPKTLAFLDFAKSLGVKEWMLSASPEIAVKTAMKHFGIETDALIGVKLKINESGIYTQEFIEPISVIEGKVTCLREQIAPDGRVPLFSVDDSKTGFPLMATTEIKVVIDRGNALAEKAKEEGEEKGWYFVDQVKNYFLF